MCLVVWNVSFGTSFYTFSFIFVCFFVDSDEIYTPGCVCSWRFFRVNCKTLNNEFLHKQRKLNYRVLVWFSFKLDSFLDINWIISVGFGVCFCGVQGHLIRLLLELFCGKFCGVPSNQLSNLCLCVESKRFYGSSRLEFLYLITNII